MDFGYKEEILSSRSQGLGGSDSNLLQKIDSLGYVPESGRERLAVIKGLTEHRDNFKTEAMALGDTLEAYLFDMLKSQDKRWVSNPCIISEKYSRPNCKLFVHIDYMMINEDTKTIIFVENKATNKTISDARHTYNNQLFVEYTLGKEMALKKGRGWKFSMRLSHYNTNGWDGNFNPEKIELQAVKFSTQPFNISNSMDIVSAEIENLTEFYKDEISGEYLPDNVKAKFDAMGTILAEIKQREQEVSAFKDKMYQFMCEKNIKSISTELFTITRTDDFERVTFDSKTFEQDKPRMYKKYLKKSKVRGSAKITIKRPKDNLDLID